MKNNMKRVCDLKPGDRFYWMGTEFRCTKVNGRVWYRRMRGDLMCDEAGSFGVKCQMKVELNEVPVKIKEVRIKPSFRGLASYSFHKVRKRIISFDTFKEYNRSSH